MKNSTTLVSTHWSESPKGAYAEVHTDGTDRWIDYFDDQGHKFFREDFPDHSIFFVEDAAENWASGIKVLHG